MAGRSDFLKTNRPNKVLLLNRLNYYNFRFGKICFGKDPKCCENEVQEILLYNNAVLK